MGISPVSPISQIPQDLPNHRGYHKRSKSAFCFQIPLIQSPPIIIDARHLGELVFTLAVSPREAANNALYSTFTPQIGLDKFKILTEYLHNVFPLSSYVLNLDELDTPTRQPGLFGGSVQSHRRLDENGLTRRIAERFKVSFEGENSPPRNIARKYIKYRTNQHQ